MADKWTGAATGGTDANVVGIPTNILKLYTNDVIWTALPVMRFDQFAVVRADLQAQPGDTIVFPKYGNLTRGGTIAEDVDLESENLTKSSITISVTEYGKAVGLTQKFLSLSFLDEMQNAAIALGRDYATVVDLMLRDALFSGTQIILAASRAAQKDVVSGDNLAITDIDAAVELLATANVMKYVDGNGEYYAGYCHPHQTTSFKKGMISIRQYQYPEIIFKGEVGEYNGVRFIETSHCPNGAAGVTEGGYDATLVASYQYGATGTDINAVDLYEAVVFGERAYGWAVALPVELREDAGYTNFGRKRRLAWYAIMGAGKIVNENIVIIRTA